MRPTYLIIKVSQLDVTGKSTFRLFSRLTARQYHFKLSLNFFRHWIALIYFVYLEMNFVLIRFLHNYVCKIHKPNCLHHKKKQNKVWTSRCTAKHVLHNRVYFMQIPNESDMLSVEEFYLLISTLRVAVAYVESITFIKFLMKRNISDNFQYFNLYFFHSVQL